MGEKLLSVTLLTLLMFLGIDWFAGWYNRFLARSILSSRFRTRIVRLVWVISAFLFWITLYRRALPDAFGITHFAFALFVFSLFGLLKTLFSKSE